MKKITFLTSAIALLVSLVISTPSFAKGPLSEGAFGIRATYAGADANSANFLYNFSDQLQALVGAGYNTTSEDGVDDDGSELNLQVGVNYFLDNIMYLGARFEYGDVTAVGATDGLSNFKIQGGLGAQVMVNDNLGVNGEVGIISYESEDVNQDDSKNTLRIGATAEVGASFYFN